MTDHRDSLDRVMTAWLRSDADVGEPAYLAETLALLDRTPQRSWRAVLARLFPDPAVPRIMMPRAVLYLALLGLVVLTLMAAAILIGSRQSLLPPFERAANGMIAYDDGRNVFVAQPDGSQAIPIEGGFRYDYTPAYSPDGTQVAFWSSQRSAGGALFVADGDGTGVARQLGVGTLLEGTLTVPPMWSPDSRSIAYPAWVPRGPSGIYVASVETGEARYVAGADTTVRHPAWSPDGKWLAFGSVSDGRVRLMLVRPDGTGLRELASVAGAAEAWAFERIGWSPDSAAMVYHRPADDAPHTAMIAVYDVARGERRISSKGTDAHAASWSPDGSRIAYLESRPEPDAPYDLIIASADGRERQSLGRVADCAASWSPDGRFLVSFAPGCDVAKLTIVPVDGGPARTVELQRNMVGPPSWQRVEAP